MKARVRSLSPMLGVKDVGKTASYYEKCLGFRVGFVAEGTDLPAYAVVSRNGLEVHLLEDPERDPSEVRSGFNATVSNVDRLYREFGEAGAFASDFPRHLDAIREHAPEDKEYGMRDVIFVDPDGFILVFGHSL